MKYLQKAVEKPSMIDQMRVQKILGAKQKPEQLMQNICNSPCFAGEEPIYQMNQFEICEPNMPLENNDFKAYEKLLTEEDDNTGNTNF